METTQTSTIASIETRSGWRKTDTMWMLGLYGTAIGAGVLVPSYQRRCRRYDPADHHGPHRLPDDLLCPPRPDPLRAVREKPGEDITEVVEEHFGVGAGKLITLLYFFAIYPILLVYSVAITNTVESFHGAPASDDAAAACHSVPDPDRRHDDHRAFRRADDCESDERAGFPICYRADGARPVSDPAVERRGAGDPLS